MQITCSYMFPLIFAAIQTHLPGIFLVKYFNCTTPVIIAIEKLLERCNHCWRGQVLASPAFALHFYHPWGLGQLADGLKAAGAL